MDTKASPARLAAHAALVRSIRDDAYVDRALRAESQRLALDPRDHQLATALVFGAEQRRGQLDALVETLAGRPPARLEPEALAALRLGLLQLLAMDGIPDHAAVSESVELAKLARGPADRLVNAVLRRAARERPALPGSSHPAWIVEAFERAVGTEHAAGLIAADDLPAEHVLRANRLRTTPEELAAALPVAAEPSPPDGLVLREPFDAHGHPLFAAGHLLPQSRASQAVARALGPLPGERVLDLCAAPGGKTTHLAALMEDRGEIVAVERDRDRASQLRATCARMGASCVRVEVADAAAFRGAGSFDRVLVDPPCSGLGTLRSRPDRRWRARPEDVPELARGALAIARNGASQLKPGGTLVYSTCTISPAENEDVLDALLAAEPGLELEDLTSDHPAWQHPSRAKVLLTMPHRDATDGFFIARARRTGP